MAAETTKHARSLGSQTAIHESSNNALCESAFDGELLSAAVGREAAACSVEHHSCTGALGENRQILEPVRIRLFCKSSS